MKVRTEMQEIVDNHLMRAWGVGDEAMKAGNDDAFNQSSCAAMYACKVQVLATHGDWSAAKECADKFDICIAKATNLLTKGRYAHSATRQSMFSKISKLARSVVPEPQEPQPGTLICGTLLEQDLIPAFIDEIRRISPTDSRLKDWNRAYARADDAMEWQEFVGDLIDALSEYAPQGYYFGAHPGDGADFGFWQYDDED